MRILQITFFEAAAFLECKFAHINKLHKETITIIKLPILLSFVAHIANLYFLLHHQHISF